MATSFDPSKAVREELAGLADVLRALQQREREAEEAMGKAEQELNAIRKLRGFAQLQIGALREKQARGGDHVMTTPFDAALNWKLRKGSHTFPGENGGTCINEAAVVAAGFEYRSVADADDLPPCFSRLFGQFLIGLNDSMRANLRQAMLMPFVTRLAGTADSDEVEAERAELMITRAVEILKPITQRSGNKSEGLEFITRNPLSHATTILDDRRDEPLVATWQRNIGDNVAVAFRTVANGLRREQPIYMLACNVLREAMRIGNQGTEVPAELVRERMEIEKGKADERRQAEDELLAETKA